MQRRSGSAPNATNNTRGGGVATICHACNAAGHKSYDCPGRKCYNCFAVGHIARDCPSPTVCNQCYEPGWVVPARFP
ncbi:hypothetical protein DFH06DRAFT_1210499 [Mycena polygramma]|nr:hypothetical protein DFH06DRAFT_1210499 [Mycena polygramma]